MDRQLYFLVDDINRCREVVDFLDKKGLTYSFLKVYASAGTDFQGFTSGSHTQMNERLRKILIGAVAGAVAGMLGGILAITTIAINSLSISDLQVLLMTAAGGLLLGVLISPIIGLNRRSHKVEQFQTAVNNGRVLLMLEMPRTVIHKTIGHVERHFKGVDVALVRS